MEKKTELETKKDECEKQMHDTIELLDKLTNTLKRDEDLIKHILNFNENLIAKNKNLELKLKYNIIHFCILYLTYFVLIVIVAFK